MLFSHFAQWFTDGFLRTDRSDPLRNTSSHDIDLCQLYGLNPSATTALRSLRGGTLKSQHINSEDIPAFISTRTAVRGASSQISLELLFPKDPAPSARRRCLLWALSAPTCTSAM